MFASIRTRDGPCNRVFRVFQTLHASKLFCLGFANPIFAGFTFVTLGAAFDRDGGGHCI